MLKNITILIAVLGLLMGIYSVATSKPVVPVPPPSKAPSVNPFPNGIAALGVVESGSREVHIAAPDPGLVTEVLVEVGDKVEEADELFMMDDRLIQAELLRARAALAAAQAEVTRHEQWPRAEDFPPAEAEVEEAKARLTDFETRLANLQRAGEQSGVSPDEMDRARFAVDVARAALRNAQSRLDRLKAGSWSADLIVARANAAARQAEINALDLRLERLTVRAPAAGTVLRRDIEPGEYVMNNGGGIAPLILGDLTTLHVRAQVDEEDAPLLRDGAKAICRLRGMSEHNVTLVMVRIEPYALPKSQITGSNTERIDTRVVEVVFLVEGKHPPLYPGQVVDVFIEAAQETGSQAGGTGQAAI